MKRILCLAWFAGAWACLAVLPAAAQPEFDQGREYLRRWGQPPRDAANLRLAHASFQKAVEQDPQQVPARVYQAITGILLLAYGPEINAILTDLGYSTEGRDLWQWTARPQNPLPQNGLTSTRILAVAAARAEPQLEQSRACLKGIPAGWNGSVVIPTNELPLPRATEVDAGDVVMMQALLEAGQGLIGAARGYNLAFAVDGILEVDGTGMLAPRPGTFPARPLQDNPLFMTVTNSAALAPASNTLASAAATYAAAAAAIRAEKDDQGDDLFTTDMLRQMDPYAQSISAPTAVEWAPEFRAQVYLAPLFGAPYVTRTALPQYNAAGDVVLGTFPDPAFHGMFPDMTQARWTEYLRWSYRFSHTSNDLFGVVHGRGLFVAVGDRGAIVTSPDGRAWTPAASGATTPLKAVACGPDGFVAAGQGGVLLASADGRAWQRCAAEAATDWEGIAYGNGRFVAVGRGGAMAAATDGAAWTPVASGVQAHLWDIVFAGGRFLALGAQGVILVSTDSREWAVHQDLAPGPLMAGAFGSDRYLALGYEGAMLASPDAQTWTALPVGANRKLSNVAFVDGRFLAVGGEGGVYDSADGRDWTRQVTRTRANLYAVTAGPELVVAVGNRGRLLTASRGAGRAGALMTAGFAPSADPYEWWRLASLEWKHLRATRAPATPRAPAPAVAAPAVRIDLQAARAPGGGNVAAVHSGLPAENRDPNAWIGFYRVDTERNEEYVCYTFLNNLVNNTYDIAAPRAPGQYHFRLFRDSGYSCIATSAVVEIE